MNFSRSDRLILGIVLSLAILGIGLAWAVNPRLPEIATGPRPEGPHKLDLNRASFSELLQLPGIGPTLAERIIRYREEHGPFRSLEKLLEIKGIGPKLLERLSGRITVSVSVPEPEEIGP